MAWVDEAPDPPVVAKVTHVSIELSWDNSVLNEKNTFTPVTNKSKFRYVVQEEEVGGLVTKGYGIVRNKLFIVEYTTKSCTYIVNC